VLDTVVADKPDNQGDGYIDWTKQDYLFKGYRRPESGHARGSTAAGAIRAAQQVALRNALETLKGIYLNSSTTVENFMVKSDVITSKVSGFMRVSNKRARNGT